MKKVLTLAAVMAAALITAAQSPQKMSYQSVVRNNSGALIVNHAIGLRISILKGSATGSVVFSETYSPVRQTNANGLLTTEIGSGTASSGSFSEIDWSAGPYFLKTETDPEGGTNYTITGTTQLFSVPYALYARTAANGFSGNYNDLTNRPVLFDGTWASLTGKPVLFDGTWGSLTGKPELFDGTWASLTGKPVLFDGTWSSLTGKPAGLADGIDNVDDADNSITNEIQLLSLSGTVLTLSNGGGTVTLPSSGGGDNWGTQTVVTNTNLTGAGTAASPLAVANTVIAPSWSNIQGIPVGLADGTDNVDDADHSITNEIQTLSIAGTSLSLSNGGGAVTIPGDNWGTQAVVTNATLTGNGTTSTPLRIAQQSATSGQVLKWNGTSSSWLPADDATGAGLTLPYSGSATATLDHGVFEVTDNRTDGVGGITAGLYGITKSPDGVGVFGRADATSKGATGVMGRTSSVSGYGVYGEGRGVGVRGMATSTSTGQTFGVYGSAESPEGCGVQGLARNTSGENHGVHGESYSTGGFGVYGTSPNVGVVGVADVVGVEGRSVQGIGVSGLSTDGTGVEGYTTSTTESAMSGLNLSTTGINFGVKGESYSSSGTGINGKSPRYGVYGTSTGNQGRAVVGEATGTASIGVRGIATNTSSTGVMGEGANYDFYANGPGVDYGTSSSIRWKKNIISIPDPLRKLKAIRGVFFDWDNEHGGRHDVGVIAEEVGKVLPEIVVYEQNGIDAIGLDYSKLTPLLLEAVKAQQKEIELLKKEIELLKAR